MASTWRWLCLGAMSACRMKEPSHTSRAPAADVASATATEIGTATASNAAPAQAFEAERTDASKTDSGATPRVVEIRKASKLYDFRVTLREPCTPPSVDRGLCEAPGSVAIFRKGADVALQQEDLDAVELALDDKGAALVNTSTLYDYQGTINVGDFDFDGHEDFAVQGPQTGPYGGPTFSVFLYSVPLGKFVRSSALSELTETTLGFFEVDTKNRRIVTRSKSGCCYHETTQYKVADGNLVRTDVVIEDAFGEEDASAPLPPNTMIVTHGHLAGGKWVTTKKRAPLPPARE